MALRRQIINSLLVSEESEMKLGRSASALQKKGSGHSSRSKAAKSSNFGFDLLFSARNNNTLQHDQDTRHCLLILNHTPDRTLVSEQFRL